MFCPQAPLRTYLAATHKRRSPANKSGGLVLAGAACAAGVAGAAAVAAAVTRFATPADSDEDGKHAHAGMPPLLVDALAGGVACGAMDVMFFADTLKARRRARNAAPFCQSLASRSLFAFFRRPP